MASRLLLSGEEASHERAQDMVRRTMASVVDPERRISLPPVKPGVGW